MPEINHSTSGIYNEVDQLKIKNEHEQIQLKEQHEYDYRLRQIDKEKELKLLNLRIGFIGRCFGDSNNSSKNITFSLCLFLIIGVIAISFYVLLKDVEESKIELLSDIWNIIIPIISLSLGYLFGKK